MTNEQWKRKCFMPWQKGWGLITRICNSDEISACFCLHIFLHYYINNYELTFVKYYNQKCAWALFLLSTVLWIQERNMQYLNYMNDTNYRWNDPEIAKNFHFNFDIFDISFCQHFISHQFIMKNRRNFLAWCFLDHESFFSNSLVDS